ncbi:hypothetical protein GC175_22810 [bacterium]|nr:hypothetical protein [bacterium]
MADHIQDRKQLAKETVLNLQYHIVANEGEPLVHEEISNVQDQIDGLIDSGNLDPDQIKNLVDDLVSAGFDAGTQWFRRGIEWGIKLAKDPSYLLVLGGNDE